jgi:hypothetical protein
LIGGSIVAGVKRLHHLFSHLRRNRLQRRDEVNEKMSGIVIAQILESPKIGPVRKAMNESAPNEPVRKAMRSGNLFEALREIGGIAPGSRVVGNSILPCVRFSPSS